MVKPLLEGMAVEVTAGSKQPRGVRLCFRVALVAALGWLEE